MNITSLEIAQATMDMFFCLFCLIMFVSIKANNPKQKSMRMFVRLFLNCYSSVFWRGFGIYF